MVPVGVVRPRSLNAAPMRIVSLLPSATEVVVELGLVDSLVGVSHECPLPEGTPALPVVSRPRMDPEAPGNRINDDVRSLLAEGLSLFKVDTDVLAQLAPDLVITQDHCEVCAVPLSDVEEALCHVVGQNTSVCTLHPGSLSDVLDDFERVAAAVGEPASGRAMADAFRARLDALKSHTAGLDRPRVALVEWLEPPMIAGGWMPELAEFAGVEPVLVTGPDRFETVDWEAIDQANPDLVVLLACGFTVPRTLEEVRRPELAEAMESVGAIRDGRWAITDGDALFNRPGPRLAESAELLATLAHPTLASDSADFDLGNFEGSYAKPGWPLS